MGDWFSDALNGIGNWASSTAGYVWDGITHPVDAVNSAMLVNEAHSHGFNTVADYQAWQAKQNAANPATSYYGTGNATADNILNTIGGVGVNVGVGLGPNASGVSAGAGMPHPGLEVPHTAQQLADNFRQAQINWASNKNDPQILAQLNKAATDYKNAMGPANVDFSQVNIPGLTYSTSLGYTPIDLTSATNWNNADGTAGQLKFDPGYEGVGGWIPVGQPLTQVGLSNVNVAPQVSVAQQQIDMGNGRPGDHRNNPATGVRQTLGSDGIWRDGNSAGPTTAASLPSNPTPPPAATSYGGVNTSTQAPMMTPQQWAAGQEAIQNDYRAYLGVGLSSQDAMSRAKANHPGFDGPQPTNNPTNPSIPGAPGTPSTQGVPTAPPPGTPGVSTAPTGQPNPNNPAAGAAAGALGGVGDVIGWLTSHGFDASTAAILAAGGASSVASWMAADKQATGATDAANAQAGAYDAALTQLGNQIHDTNLVNTNNYTDQQAKLDPYLKSGTDALAAYNTTLGGYDPNKALSGDPSTWQDPSYHFRLDEGMKALQSSAAAKGGLLSGNTMRGITDYAQNAASQEYKNAYDRYNTTFNTRINALQPLVNSGQQAVGQYIGAGNNYASNTQQAAQANQSAYANLTTGKGNALAQGILGAANAKASGYAAGNTIAQGMLSQYSQLNAGNAANNLAAALSSLTKPKVV